MISMRITLTFLVVIAGGSCQALDKIGKKEGKAFFTPEIGIFGKDFRDGAETNACCVCGQPVSVTIVANNEMQKPFFKIKTEVRQPKRELIRLLETAATQDKRFRFSADHYGPMGYIVTSINQITSNSTANTYWHVASSQSFTSLPMGISQYMPVQGEVIFFNFTTYA